MSEPSNFFGIELKRKILSAAMTALFGGDLHGWAQTYAPEGRRPLPGEEYYVGEVARYLDLWVGHHGEPFDPRVHPGKLEPILAQVCKE